MSRHLRYKKSQSCSAFKKAHQENDIAKKEDRCPFLDHIADHTPLRFGRSSLGERCYYAHSISTERLRFSSRRLALQCDERRIAGPARSLSLSRNEQYAPR